MNFKYPKLNKHCQVNLDNDEIIIRIFNGEYVIQPENSSTDNLMKFLDSLTGNREVSSIKDEFGSDFTDESINFLDELKLLDDGEIENSKCSGLSRVLEIEKLITHKWLPEVGEGKYTKIYYDGDSDKTSYINHLINYYKVTQGSAEAICSVLINQHDPNMYLGTIDFFKDEYRHDLLLKRDLLSHGLTEKQVMNSYETPISYVLMAMLGNWGLFDPISHFLAIMIYEGNSFENDVYIKAADQYEFNSGKVSGINKHNDINEEGEHDDVARSIISHISYISDENFEVIKQKVKAVVELRKVDEDHLAQYSESVNSIRVLPDIEIQSKTYVNCLDELLYKVNTSWTTKWSLDRNEETYLTSRIPQMISQALNERNEKYWGRSLFDFVYKFKWVGKKEAMELIPTAKTMLVTELLQKFSRNDPIAMVFALRTFLHSVKERQSVNVKDYENLILSLDEILEGVPVSYFDNNHKKKIVISSEIINFLTK
ncbi:hypothetical protein AB6C57_22460 [Vibrio splendidus]